MDAESDLSLLYCFLRYDSKPVTGGKPASEKILRSKPMHLNTREKIIGTRTNIFGWLRNHEGMSQAVERERGTGMFASAGKRLTVVLVDLSNS